MWARISALLAAVLASFILTGAGQADGGASGPENPAAARAVAVLTGIAEGPVEDAVPDDFTDVMGYEPQIVTNRDGGRDRGREVVRVLRADGDCSSGFGSTTYDFDRACKTHDYGYGLLRYAAKNGGELGLWARVAIDELLRTDLHRRCAVVNGGGACRVVADIGFALVKANSWRQGQGVPSSEEAGPYIASGALILAAIVLPPVAVRVGRARRSRSAASAVDDGTAASAVDDSTAASAVDDSTAASTVEAPALDGGMAWTAGR